MIKSKKEIIRLLEKIATYMELQGENTFKIAAFRKAAQSIEQDQRSLAEIKDLTKLANVGQSTGSVIQEFLKTGRSELLEKLQKEVPPGLIPLLKVQGLGGKKLARLYQELGIIDQTTLLEQAEKGNIEKLKGFGKKSTEKMVDAVKELGNRPERYPLIDCLGVVQTINHYLAGIQEIDQFEPAGSFRRLKETIKDLDYVIATSDAETVKEKLLLFPLIEEITGAGMTKISAELAADIKITVDFRLVTPAEFSTALHHFTGSKDHNVRIRQLAKAKSEKMSEYGVLSADGSIRTFKTEADFFHHFELPFIPPELREDGTEIDRMKSNPHLIEKKDIRGDLHLHTTWTDGAYSIREMVESCLEKGYSYMVITDHGKFLRVAGGLDEKRLFQQITEIRRIDAMYPEIDVYTGVEMDILTDGTLDFSDEILSQLDFIIASIHSGFSQSEEKIMARLQKACENPYVRLIAHPTGRLIGRRPPYQVNMKKLVQIAKKTGTALELNANPNRLDLNRAHLELAKKQGVKIAINTDAHDPSHLDFMNIGVRFAKKAWLAPEDVINTMDRASFRAFLQKKP